MTVTAAQNTNSLTISVEEAAKRLGISRNSAYDAVRKSEIPTIRVGKRILVPVHHLDSLLGKTSPLEFTGETTGTSMMKDVYPWLAPMLGSTEMGLRAFQRTLMEDRRIPYKQGRGPGSGVSSSPQNIARFVALYVASRSAQDIGKLVERIEAFDQ